MDKTEHFSIENENDFITTVQKVNEAESFIRCAKNEIIKYVINENRFEFFSLNWRAIYKFVQAK